MSILAGGPAPASAQTPCEQWREGSGTAGVNGWILDMAEWDADEAGPRPSTLVAVGSFGLAGGVAANNVAAWDGASWQSLGGAGGGGGGVTGGDNYTLARAVAVYHGEVVVAGHFTLAGGVSAPGLARWNGASWRTLGSGLTGEVFALAVYHDQLIAAGQFSSIGGAAAANIASWNGSTWTSMGQGITGPSGSPGYGPDVRALTVFQDRLIAGGEFAAAGGVGAGNVAAWDGAAWQPVGTGTGREDGMAGGVYRLLVYRGDLVAAGTFDRAGGNAASRIARWNGASWLSLGAGAGPVEVSSLGMYGLTELNGSLYVGGFFTYAGGAAASNVARWDGSAWAPVGTGIGYQVNAMATFRGAVIAGGYFGDAGGAAARGLARWDGGAWSALGRGNGGAVAALAVYGNEVIAAGRFTSLAGTPLKRIARRTGATWGPLNTGLDGGGQFSTGVNAMTSYNNELVVGGDFSTAGNVSARNIARWNGAAWHNLGAGINGTVYAFAVYNGELIAGGDFTMAGSVPASCIAKWNGAAWQNLGNGLAAPSNFPLVESLAVYGGGLYAGGYFTLAGIVPARSIAMWNGLAWSDVGGGLSTFSSLNIPFASAMAVYNGELIVGGTFDRSGGGVAMSNMGRWNGMSWSSLGAGVTAGFSPVSALLASGGELIATGNLQAAGGQPASFIARWNGVNWGAYAGGLDGPGYCLTAFDPDGPGPIGSRLLVGGSFGSAGGRVSAYLAEWGTPSDSVWVAPQGGSAAIASNWACMAVPDATQGIVFDRAAAGVALNPSYQVNMSAPLAAMRLAANSDLVFLNLAGQPLTLAQPASLFSPALVIGDRAGASGSLTILNSSAAAPTTATVSGLTVGRAAGSGATLTVRDPGTTLRLAGSGIIGDGGAGVMNVENGALLSYGAGAGDILALGLAPCGASGSAPCATLNASGGRIAAASAIDRVSIGAAAGARAAVSLSGAAAVWNASQSDFIVGDVGNGRINITGGAQLNSSTSNRILLSRLAGSSSSVSITGAGSKWEEAVAGMTVGSGGAASINVASGGVLRMPTLANLSGGTLGGDGQVASLVTNLGVIAPGNTDAGAGATGTLTITGSLAQLGQDPLTSRTESGELRVKIGGTGAGQSDRLVVDGSVLLGGSLTVHFTNNFQPGPSDSFRILDAGSHPIDKQFDVVFFDALTAPALASKFMRASYEGLRGPGGNGVTITLGTLPVNAGFGNPQEVLRSNVSSVAALGDLNQDGKPDLAIAVQGTASTDPGTVVVLLNDGQGNFIGSGSSQVTVGVNPTAVTIADINNDGRNDLIVAHARRPTDSGTGTDTILIKRQLPAAGTFEPGGTLVVLADGTRLIAIATVDLDPLSTDHLLDIVSANEGGGGLTPDTGSVTLLHNLAGAAFAPRTIPMPRDRRPRSIRPIRADQDKDPDLCVSAVDARPGSAGAGTLTVLVNTGSGTAAVFTNDLPLFTFDVGSDPVDVQTGPLGPGGGGGGGLEDVITSNAAGGSVSILRNTTTEVDHPTFSPAVEYAIGSGTPGVPSNPGSVVLTDLDNDGDLDVALLASTGSTNRLVKLLRNDSTVQAVAGTTINQVAFTPLADRPSGSCPSRLLAGELNGDGRVDLITVNAGCNRDGPGSTSVIRSTLPAPVACCRGSTCALVAGAQQCTGPNTAVGGVNIACQPLGGSPAPCCRADFNHTGGVTVQDIFDFLIAYFANSALADANDSGAVTVQDIFNFLIGYFGGC